MSSPRTRAHVALGTALLLACLRTACCAPRAEITGGRAVLDNGVCHVEFDAATGGIASLTPGPESLRGQWFEVIEEDRAGLEPWETWRQGPVSAFAGGPAQVSAENAPVKGAFKPAQPCPRTDTQDWRTHTFMLDDARLANREHQGADYRLHARGTDLRVRRVAVRAPGRCESGIVVGPFSVYQATMHGRRALPGFSVPVSGLGDQVRLGEPDQAHSLQVHGAVARKVTVQAHRARLRPRACSCPRRRLSSRHSQTNLRAAKP